MNALQRWSNTIFTGDVCIAKRDVPVLAVVCIFSLLGAMYFGMFFARQEVLHQAQTRQDELVTNFATIASNKDKQIRALTDALSDSQDAYHTKLTSIEGMTTEIAIFLSQSAPLDDAGVKRLRERVQQIQAAAAVRPDTSR